VARGGASIARYTPDSEARLEPGDLLLLYTDGITEAMNGNDEQFGLDRLCAVVEEAAPRGVGEVSARLLAAVAAWAPRQVDDVTLLVIRREAA
jgi:serine phosphatase RsbU (regulator of sigma subunit)